MGSVMQTSAEKPKRIFVSIASFCDPMLTFTVKSAIENARHPERLSFGIVDQSKQASEGELPSGSWRTGYLHIAPHQSRGACWARSLAMTLYADEDFFLQIDSHTCFDADWDVTLIDTLEAITARTGNAKVVVSTRPFAFEIEADGSVKKNRFTDGTLKLTPKDSVLKLSEPVMKFSCVNSKEMQDLPGFQVSAAFLFARGSFIEEVPYDPFFYFHGEEQDVSIRAFTHGWDIWHPNSLPIFHLYKTREAGEAPLHWDAEFEQQRGERWIDLRTRANGRLSDLIAGRLKGVYALGAVRSIADYLKVSGLTMESPPGTLQASTDNQRIAKPPADQTPLQALTTPQRLLPVRFEFPA